MSRLTAPAFLLALLLASREAVADLFVFTGTVTSVDDPFGALSDLAAVGAPVDGSFYFGAAPVTGSTFNPTSPSYLSFESSPQVMDYLGERSFFPGLTDLSLTIGGAAERAASYSTTNIHIGNDVPPGTRSPSGDYFRYLDLLAIPPGERDALVDYSVFDTTDYLADPIAQLTLVDPSGLAFSSRDLPQGVLPLEQLTNRLGEFSASDDNGEYEGALFSVQFRIDSIRAVPEPGGPALLAAATIPGAVIWLRRRAVRRRSPRS